jgi:hypothetical protein
MSIDPKLQIRKLKSADGTIRFVKDNKFHNPDGPAIIYPDGKEEYYLNGILYTKDAHKKIKKDSNGLPWYKSGAAKTRH